MDSYVEMACNENKVDAMPVAVVYMEACNDDTFDGLITHLHKSNKQRNVHMKTFRASSFGVRDSCA